ncbi:MAG: tRNA 2-selenouridine synthase [Hyphococcus sp.]|nr:MAG: tRNA 2-selenouridine synthase [Marinicaulis sp.]
MAKIDTIDDTGHERLTAFDAIIDVRSPDEFNEDHIPGAVNLPVLSNEERAEVGAIYKQQSKFIARKIGAAHVSRNIARHLDTYFKDKPRDFHPLIYCWRGGMRSGTMATILSQVGWCCTLLEGGYKTWRRNVVASLHDHKSLLNVMLIDGQTGAGKTELLRHAKSLGAQTIDLEDYAAHRGSVFGAEAMRPQPSQKLFESLLCRDLQSFAPDKPVLIEAESNRIHRCQIPKRLWASMRAAPHILVTATPEARAHAIVKSYRDQIDTPGAIQSAIERLRSFHPKPLIEEWQAMDADKQYLSLAESLIRHHYDPLYDRSRKRRASAPITIIELDPRDEGSLKPAAKEAVSATAQVNCNQGLASAKLKQNNGDCS